MLTDSIIKIIETSTIKRLEYELKYIGGTLWKVSGSIPYVAIKSLHEANYTCYLSKDEFFISSIGMDKEGNSS